MISDPRRRALLVVLAVLVTGSRSRAGGDPDDQGAGQRLIADAVAEYDAGHFEEARALFRRTQAESPSARTLRGIGMASFELRDYVDATRALTAALGEQRHALTPEQRGHVEQLLARAEAFVARFTLRLEPRDATLSVDGRAAEREPDGTLLLPFGRHQIVARCPTCAEWEQQIEVLGGERKDLAITLRAAGGGAADAVVKRDDTKGGHAAVPARGGAAAYWLAGTGAVAAVGAVVGALWWRDRAHELDFCRQNGPDCKNEPTVADQRRTAAGVTLGLGAAAVAAGVVAAILWPRQRTEATSALACFGTGGGMSCAIRF